MSEEQQAERLLCLFKALEEFDFVEVVSDELRVSAYVSGVIYKTIKGANYESNN